MTSKFLDNYQGIEIEGKTDREIELERALQEQEAHIAQLTKQIKQRGTESKYQDEYIPILLKHMGIEGKSYQSLAFKLGLNSVKTLYNWEKRYPEWKAAKEIANMGRLSFIEDMLMDLGTGKNKGNAAAAIFYAKNAAPDEFKDKREIEVGGNVTYLLDTGIPKRELPETIDDEIIEAEFQEVEPQEIESPDNFEDLL